MADMNEKVVQHLNKVYVTLALMLGLSAAGVYFQIMTSFSSFFSTLICFGFLLGLVFSFGQDNTTRLALLSGFCFFEGSSLGELISYVIEIDPKLVIMAFSATTLIFLSFSAVALFSSRRSYLYLGGLISSTMTTLALFGIFNMFFGMSSGFANLYIYVSLFAFMGYIIFDTQVVIEKADLGDMDYITHSLELFIDFVGLFVRILIILSKNKKNDKKH